MSSPSVNVTVMLILSGASVLLLYYRLQLSVTSMSSPLGGCYYHVITFRLSYCHLSPLCDLSCHAIATSLLCYHQHMRDAAMSCPHLQEFCCVIDISWVFIQRMGRPSVGYSKMFIQFTPEQICSFSGDKSSVLFVHFYADVSLI
jgi:hypothetical protein